MLMLKPLPDPPLMSRKEARLMIGVRKELFEELLRRKVLRRVAVESWHGFGKESGAYLRTEVAALAARVSGMTYGKRRELLGIGRKCAGNTL